MEEEAEMRKRLLAQVERMRGGAATVQIKKEPPESDNEDGIAREVADPAEEIGELVDEIHSGMETARNELPLDPELVANHRQLRQPIDYERQKERSENHERAAPTSKQNRRRIEYVSDSNTDASPPVSNPPLDNYNFETNQTWRRRAANGTKKTEVPRVPIQWTAQDDERLREKNAMSEYASHIAGYSARPLTITPRPGNKTSRRSLNTERKQYDDPADLVIKLEPSGENGLQQPSHTVILVDEEMDERGGGRTTAQENEIIFLGERSAADIEQEKKQERQRKLESEAREEAARIVRESVAKEEAEMMAEILAVRDEINILKQLIQSKRVEMDCMGKLNPVSCLFSAAQRDESKDFLLRAYIQKDDMEHRLAQLECAQQAKNAAKIKEEAFQRAAEEQPKVMEQQVVKRNAAGEDEACVEVDKQSSQKGREGSSFDQSWLRKGVNRGCNDFSDYTITVNPDEDVENTSGNERHLRRRQLPLKRRFSGPGQAIFD